MGTAGRRAAAEAVGTALLLATVVGSGIMGERLAAGNAAIALLANSIATGAILIALILTLAPISGAHFNPVVTLSLAAEGRLQWPEAFRYLMAQVAGAISGVALANLMFGEPVIAFSRHARGGSGQILSETVATFGLVFLLRLGGRFGPDRVAFVVGAYITAAYWFTASTAFANPAVTLARSLSDTFAGIRPGDVLPFVVAQALGATAATAVSRWLLAPASGEK